MEKKKKIHILMEKQLPEEVIQHIQSFLDGKEAARTTILSKPWYTAWLTRPNLDFAYVEFRERSVFEEHVKKAMQRYDELNINIHTFRLLVNAYATVTISTAKEFILKAIELGATDVYFDGTLAYSFPLPSDMFESETLVSLSLRNCKIDLRDQKSTRTKLKCLKLSGVRIQGITFWGISWMFPLIEELSIAERGIGHVHSMMVLERGLGVYVFRKLKVLSLENVRIGEGAFDDFSSKFPCLKELALVNCSGCKEIQIQICSNSVERISLNCSGCKEIQICSNSVECISLNCSGCKEIQICSNSLECISFNNSLETLRATLDVPRIRKFKYSGSGVPSLSFKAIHTEREWVSDISIKLYYIKLEKSWYLKLREFLHGQSPSKISLYLYISCYYDRVYKNPDVKPPIVVENLTLLVDFPYSLHRAILDGLFRCFRPSVVNLSWSPLPQTVQQKKANNDFTKFLCETLLKGSGEKQNISALHDLEEANVKYFEDDAVKGCSPLPCNTLSNASAYSKSIAIKVCLQLRWGGST